MILHALNTYYTRLRVDARVEVPLFGFSRQNIHFALLIDTNGTLLQVQDLREVDANRFIPRRLTVPEPPKRTSGIAPTFMWDNTGYVLGADSKGNPARSLQQFTAFKRHHHDLGDGFDDEGMKAVLRFLDNWDPREAATLDLWEEMAGMHVVFQLDGELRFVHERPAIQDLWVKHFRSQSSTVVGTCLVSGQQKPIARLHPDIKRVRGTQAKGAALVSFNRDAFTSYGKTQSFNAPVGEDAAFAYSTALNHLLRPESRQRVQIGDASTVFWTERESPIEGFMGLILDPRDDAADLKELRDFLEAVRDGRSPPNIDDPDMNFYMLGLSPNAARIAVRFWHVSSVADISAKLGQHFQDLAIVRSYETDRPFPGMWQLLRETAVQGRSENISPSLAGALMRSILLGVPYPYILLTAVINRIRADQRVTYLRAAMIKAYLVRKHRSTRTTMEVSMALNAQTTNVAYRLGRLFAALEKAQRDAVPGAGSTIKDRFYGAASAAPRTVFPQLLRLAQHHIQKATYGHRTEKLIEDVMSGIETFPAHLTLDDQGLFALGYYHQRQALYAKVSAEEE
jgi:CRISPR-associated protein Csd1